MKTIFLSLTLLTSLQVHRIPAQDLKIHLTSIDYAVDTDFTKKPQPNSEAPILYATKPDSLSENDQMLLAEYYKLDNNPAKNCAHTSDGKSYTGTKNGIKMCDVSSTIIISTENSNLPENNITALALDKDEHLWIGTFSSGIVIGVGACIKPYKIKPIKTRDSNIYSISVDEKGRVWVTFRNGGIECFRNGKSIAYFSKV